MIWLAWRLQRAQTWALLGLAVVVVVAALVLRGVTLSQVDPSCLVGNINYSMPCTRQWGSLGAVMTYFQLLLVAMPFAIGLFCGAPLFARELEQGTHVLAFTQSVSRTRWMLVKAAVAVVPALLSVLAMQVALSYWFRAAGSLGPYRYGPWSEFNFPTSHLAPAAFTLAGLATGMLIGAIARKTLLAMVITVGLFLGVWFAALGTRELYVSTERVTYSAYGGGDYPRIMGAQPIDSGYVNADGATVSHLEASALTADCSGADRTQEDYTACYRDNGLVASYLDYLPAAKAKTAHLIEAALLLALAAACVAGTARTLRRVA
ncbi:hypothetical protein [Actinokineospora pegani]|uniref:hypothetical protein n=1 Tax=Actinokineospora pegani TaxID=2654637 RepID=UPI0012EAEC02|nr:hypothetical protein [Actinokineospora pegani]